MKTKTKNKKKYEASKMVVDIKVQVPCRGLEAALRGAGPVPLAWDDLITGSS